MKLLVKKGKTSKIVQIFIQDNTSTTGAGLSTLTSGSTGLVCYRARSDDGNAGATQITLSAGTRGTWSSGGFIAKDTTNMPGVYEFGVPDAALATGADQVIIMFFGNTGMAPLVLEIQLVDFDPQSATNLGLTNLDATISSRMATYTQPTGFLAATFPSGTVANQTNITAGTITTATNLTTNNDKTGYTLTQAFPTNFSSLGITAGGHITTTDTLTNGVTVTTNSDKTGYALTSGERTSVADALLDRDMSLGVDSGSSTVRTMRNALRFLRNKWSISGTTLTVTKEDDSTSAWTSALVATPGANPITASDPV